MKTDNAIKRILCVLTVALPTVFLAAEPVSLAQALSCALENNSTIQMKAYGVAGARGRLKEARAPTDLSVGASVKYGHAVSPIDENDTDNNYSSYGIIAEGITSDSVESGVWARKLFRMGLTAKLSMSVSRKDDEASIPGFTVPDSYTYLSDPEARNYGGAELELSLPLLKAFGDSVASKNIEAAGYYLEQQEMELEDSISQIVMSVSDAYWNYAIAYMQYANLTETANRLKEREKNLESLVGAGVAAKTEMVWMKANIAKNNTSIILARNAAQEALNKLEKLMGLSSDKMGSITEPSDVFSDNLDRTAEWNVDETISDDVIRQSVAKRLDVKAVERQLRAAESQMQIAKINSRPDLNVTMTSGYTGTKYDSSAESYFSSISDNVRGINYSAGLYFSMDIPNNKGGSHESAEAQYNQAKLQLDNKMRDAYIETKQTFENLSDYLEALVNSLEVAKLHATLIQGEQKRFDAGFVTVDKLYDLEEQYVSARAQYYNSFRSYLMTILLIRYYSGSLAGFDDGPENSFSMDSLYRLPEIK